MRPSLTPLLLAVEIGFFVFLAWRTRSPGEGGPVAFYLGWVVAYVVAASAIGAQGVYLSDPVLASFPGLWLLLIPLVAIAAPVMLFASVRNAMRRIVDETPWHWFAWFHAIRISALGTAYKTSIGEFPWSFEAFVGVPDLCFGLSALWIAARARRGAVSVKTFMRWNAVGVLAIVPAAPLVLQLGLPGPLQVFTSLPDTRAVLTWPMSMAPMAGVPIFVLANTLVAWRLWERRETTT